MQKKQLYFLFLIFVSATSIFAQSKVKSKLVKLEVNERIINVDLNNSKGAFNTMFKECVGAGYNYFFLNLTLKNILSF